MLKHIIWLKCLLRHIYFLTKWSFLLFIVWLNHLSELFLAVLVEIAIKIIESMKYSLSQYFAFPSMVYSA